MTRAPSASRLGVLFACGVVLLVAVMALSLMIGAFTIAPSEVLRWIRDAWAGGADDATSRVLWSIRLPRILAGALAGAGLGAVGAALQGVYRTPLADPHLLGVSSAAGLGVAIGAMSTPPGHLPLVPFLAGAVGAVAFGVISSRLRSSMGSDRLVLAGVAFGFAILAWTGLFVSIVDNERVPTLGFFIFGSLAGVTWKSLIPALVLLIPASIVLWVYGSGIDLLSLGDRDARSLGFDTRRLIPIVVAAAAIATAAAVGLAGVVGFVGLIVPFFLRRFVGPGHRVLIPASAIGGAVTLVAADTIARSVAAPSEVPLGLITATLGGPLLVWLLVRRSAA